VQARAGSSPAPGTKIRVKVSSESEIISSDFFFTLAIKLTLIMFDFEKLEVYKKSKAYNQIIFEFIKSQKNLDKTTKDQLRRASFSVMLNIAEGSSRFSAADRRNFYVISRGSVFECVAIFDFLSNQSLMNKELYLELYSQSEEISKILFAMIRNLETKKKHVKSE
jgi:four helix bundle protein